MEWWPFLIFHRGGLRIKVINNSQSLATTNAIENLNGTIRRVSRNVKRWKSPSMVRRWTALGVVTAEKEFRRIKGYRHMGALVHALRSKQKSLDSDEFAA